MNNIVRIIKSKVVNYICFFIIIFWGLEVYSQDTQPIEIKNIPIRRTDQTPLQQLQNDLRNCIARLEKAKKTLVDLENRIKDNAYWDMRRDFLEADGKATEVKIRLDETFDAIKIQNDMQYLISMSQPNASIIITDIEIGNTGLSNSIIDAYGATLYSPRLRLLTPQILYEGLKTPSQNISFTVKIISYGAPTSTNAEYITEATLFAGNNRSLILTGMGDRSLSVYTPGIYRLEIWDDNICLGQKLFVIEK